jgi:hypothetical protein
MNETLDGYMEAIVMVPRQRLVDMFITACEGGSNYWCSNVDHPAVKGQDHYQTMLLNGFTAVEEGDEGLGKVHTVTPVQIQHALKVMAQKHARHFSDMLTENDDATTADVFFQLCVLGDVIYG